MDNNNDNESREHYHKRMEERIQRGVNERKCRECEEAHNRREDRLRREEEQSSSDYQPPKKHHYRTPNWVRTLIGLLICLVVVGEFYEYHKVHSIAKGVFGAGDGKISKKLQKGEPVSVLATGTDVGALDRGNEGGNAGSLELFTINPKKKTITMTSIPRDVLVRVETSDGPDYIKINAACSINGPKQTVKQALELLDVPIDYYTVINMGVLEKVVSSVGEVEVDNPFAFDYGGHHFKKGKQHLNGANASKYSQVRYDDPNNDYGRQKRQQQILESVINKFRTSGSIGAANRILDVVGNGVKTNIPIDDIATLYGDYHGAMNNVKTYHFQGQGATIEGVSFQIASPKEINRVLKLVRAQLGLKAKNIVNHETKMYKSQPHYNGYNETSFILPSGASYNDLGSGNGSDEVISSSRSSRRSTNETESSSIYTAGNNESYSESRAVPTTGNQTPTAPIQHHYSTPQYHTYNGYHSTYTRPTYGSHYGYTYRYY